MKYQRAAKSYRDTTYEDDTYFEAAVLDNVMAEYSRRGGGSKTLAKLKRVINEQRAINCGLPPLVDAPTDADVAVGTSATYAGTSVRDSLGLTMAPEPAPPATSDNLFAAIQRVAHSLPPGAHITINSVCG